MEHQFQKKDAPGAHLFVYGTLRKGFRSHGLLRRFRARLVGNGSVRGRLYNLGEYPGAVVSAGDRERVFGELYLLPQPGTAFKVLDKFEGFDPEKPEASEFERKETTVTLAGGREMSAWIYWLSGVRAAGRRVPAGNYVLCQK